MTDPLPRKVMVDTGVFVRGLGQRLDEKAATCRELVGQLFSRDCRIYLAAPALAEMLRWGSASAIPRRRELVIAAFDERAARVLGETFPLAALEAQKASEGSSLTHLKYDSMIVACAIRYGVDVHVSIDADHHKLCERAGFRCMRPDELLQRFAMADSVD